MFTLLEQPVWPEPKHLNVDKEILLVINGGVSVPAPRLCCKTTSSPDRYWWCPMHYHARRGIMYHMNADLPKTDPSITPSMVSFLFLSEAPVWMFLMQSRFTYFPTSLKYSKRYIMFVRIFSIDHKKIWLTNWWLSDYFGKDNGIKEIIKVTIQMDYDRNWRFSKCQTILFSVWAELQNW